MYQAHCLIEAEHFTPQITAQLLNIFDAAWAGCKTKNVHCRLHRCRRVVCVGEGRSELAGSS